MAQTVVDPFAPPELPPPPPPVGAPDRSSSLRTALLVFIVVVAVAVFFGACWRAFEITFTPFDNPPSEREEAIAGQALLVALWAAVSVACAAAAFAGRTLFALGAAAWTVALLWVAPWWWPSAPTFSRDYVAVPIWQDGSIRPPVFGLAALCIALGVLTAWQYGRVWRVVAGVAAGSLIIVLCASGLRLHLARRAEEPFISESMEAATLAAEAEPFWTELPSGPGTAIERELGTSASWREDDPSRIEWRGPSDDPVVMLEDLVDVAERTGWSVVSARCDPQPSVSLTKDVRSRPTTLRVEVTSDVSGLVAVMRVGGDDRYLGDTIERC